MWEAEQIKEERLKQQIAALRSGNRTAILGALRELRSTGNISILQDLFDLLLDQEDEQIRAEVISMLNDLKEKEAAPVLAAAIRNPDHSGILEILVAACWQNGLDYSEHMDTFVEVISSSSYEAAIEAFTVIEDSIGELDQQERERLLSKLNACMENAGNEKKPLLGELVRVLVHY